MKLTDKDKVKLSRLKRENRGSHIRDLATGEFLHKSRASQVKTTVYVALRAIR